MRTGRLLVGAVVCASSYLLIGCIGDLVEIKSTPETDMAAGGVDGGDDAAPVEMGPMMAPHFFPDIQADLDQKNCAVGGCHLAGSQMPTFVKNPTTQADKDTNYNNFKAASIDAAAMANPAMSPMLKIMLPGGTHPGGQQLSSTSDPVYKRWLAWVAGGGQK